MMGFPLGFSAPNPGESMRALGLVALALAAASPLSAQTLRDNFSRLYTFGQCGRPLCLDVNAAVHGEHYNPSVAQGEDNLLAFLENAIGVAVGNIPFSAAASGVTFSFEGGVPVATTVSAGPIFADRAETLGQGRLLFGANVSGISFSKVRGKPLDNLVLRFPHQNVGGAALGDPSFERDYIEVATNLDLSLLVTTVYATYGVNDRIDIGIAVPLVRAKLTGSSRATFIQFQPQNSPHFFGTEQNRQVVANAEAEGSAFGLGDIAGRLKIYLASGTTYGFALLTDFRLGTGSEEDFLGSGATTLRVQGVGSARMGNFSPHFNAGVLLNGAENQTNRLVGTVGFDQLLGEQITFAGDLVGSFQLGESPLGLPDPVVYTAPAPAPFTLNLTDIPDKTDHFLDASVGAKILVGPDFRVVTNLLLPLTNSGVRPSVTWTVGLERTF